MASDLATMLLSGNAAGLAQDPAMAQIAPQVQLAQALTQQGISTAPAYPMQALGRLAQTLAGVKVMNDATGELQNVYGNAAQAASRALPDDHPLQKALKSPDPYARMVALQTFPKAMLLGSEAKGLRPGETLNFQGGGGQIAANTGGAAAAAEAAKNPALIARAGGTAAAENPALIARAGGTAQAQNPALIARAGGTAAAENPALIARAGGTAQAQNPALIAREAQIAAAKSPYEAGGNVVVQTPRGPETIPATAATRAAIQPNIGAPAAPIGPVHSAGPAAPNFNDRFSGVGGEPVKTPEYLGDIKGREELYGAAHKALGTVVSEAIEGGGRATRDKLNALDTMESAIRTSGGHIITGPNAEFALKAKQALTGIGLNADWIDKGLPQTEIVSKMNAQLASASAKAMTGRPTQAEFLIWQRNTPGLMTSQKGTLALIDVLRQQAGQDIALSKLAQNKANWEKWPEVVDKFYQENGLINPITHKPMREEIAAAAKGGSGGANAGPAPKVGERKQFQQGWGVWNGTTYVPEKK